jgi:sugar phosphate isomerase/epimerase
MLIGCCTSAIAQAKTIAASGLDYVEENVQAFLAPEGCESDFRARSKQASISARTIQAACCFLPGALKCVGPTVDDARLDSYAQTAFARARAVGMDTIVFGSGGARAVPEGWASDKAFAQFVTVLKRFAPFAAKQGVTLVVEPLNRGECNFINTIDEGAEVVRAVDHPSVRLLADLFHMLRNDEGPECLTTHGALLAHTHVAEKETRSAPGVKGDDFRPFLRALRAGGYNHRMSLECGFGDISQELAASLKALRGQLADVGY